MSKWFTVDQTMIDRFAEATEDHQFIHTDPVRASGRKRRSAAPSPTASCRCRSLSAMNYDCLPRVIEQTMGINYGFEKVRFMAPVKCGARAVAASPWPTLRFRGAGMLMVTLRGDRRDRERTEARADRQLDDYHPVRPEGPAGGCGCAPQNAATLQRP